MRKRVIIVLSALVCIVALVWTVGLQEKQRVKDVIEDYYKGMGDSLRCNEVQAFDQILDMTQIQNQNKVDGLKSLIFRSQYLLEHYGIDIHINSIPDYDLRFINCITNADHAEVSVEIIPLEREPYPDYIISGLNEFILKKEAGEWLIISHIYQDTRLEADMTVPYGYDEEREIRLIENTILPSINGNP